MKYKNMSDRDLLDTYEQAKDEQEKVHEARIHHSFGLNKRSNVGKLKYDIGQIIAELVKRGLKSI